MTLYSRKRGLVTSFDSVNRVYYISMVMMMTVALMMGGDGVAVAE